MRVLCVSPTYWPAFQFGGPIFSVHELNKRLASKGVEVGVYTTNAGLEKGPDAVSGPRDLNKIRVNYFAYSKSLHYFGSTGWHFSPAMSCALSKNINNFDIIYIVAVWNYPAAIAAYHCRRNKKPYIISPRGSLYPCVTQKKFYKKWLYYNLVTKRDLSFAAAIHYTTQDEERSCHTHLGLKNRAFVVPNGVNLAEFANLPDSGIFKQRYPAVKGKKIILFLGRINWKKGLDILIDAYRMLTHERSDLHLVIAGNDEGGYVKQVRGWIAKFNLKDKLTITGMLIGENKLEAYAASDLFILPSYSENFGMTAVEAMACARPVIISDKVGISGEIRENNAGMVVECSAVKLCEAIKQLLDNAGLAKTLSSNGQSMVTKYYNIEDIAERMLVIFKEAC